MKGSAVLALAVILFPSAAKAQLPETNRPWHYQLIEGSFLTEECLLCGRPTIPVPMRGSFDLFLVSVGPLFTDFAMRNIDFQSGTNQIRGEGTFRFGGQLAVMQDMRLEVEFNGRPLVFTNEDRAPTRRFPNIAINVTETPAGLVFYYMDIAAAPFREIWFSTVSGFTSAHAGPRGPGDLLSASGPVVTPNRQMVENLGITPAPPHLAIDALEIGPGGEILFSLNESLGALRHGDVLSQRGSVAHHFQELMAAFRHTTPTFDHGLDALAVKDDGEVIFSVDRGFFSNALGTNVDSGDLISNRGQIIAPNRALLAAFDVPIQVGTNYGLDAVHVWPHGEIWFSTESGFESAVAGQVQPGDLLSDQGFVVYRNLELLSAFAPVEDLADFGLDGLFVVSDLTTGGGASALPPRFTRFETNKAGDVLLAWTGGGRVFQVQRAENVDAPFANISQIQPDTSFRDPAALERLRGFYRLRQW